MSIRGWPDVIIYIELRQGDKIDNLVIVDWTRRDETVDEPGNLSV